MSVDQAITKSVQDFEKATTHMKEEFSRLQIGRASAALIENVPVEVYGQSQPLKAIANISIPDPRSLVIQPWDRGSLAAIEKGIVGIGVGLNPINDGNLIRINIPPLTEERRAELAKKVKQLAEEAKISVRTARQDAHNVFKKLKAESELTEDDLRDADKRLQTKVDEVNGKIDEMAKTKEADIMKI